MKVFNLTDVETPVLKQHGVLNQMFAIGTVLVSPGQSADVADERAVHLASGLQHLVSIGALAVGDQPPAGYRLAKERARPAPEPERPAKTKKRGDEG